MFSSEIHVTTSACQALDIEVLSQLMVAIDSSNNTTSSDEDWPRSSSSCQLHFSASEGHLLQITMASFTDTNEKTGQCQSFFQIYHGRSPKLAATEKICSDLDFHDNFHILSTSSHVTLFYNMQLLGVINLVFHIEEIEVITGDALDDVDTTPTSKLNEWPTSCGTKIFIEESMIYVILAIALLFCSCQHILSIGI